MSFPTGEMIPIPVITTLLFSMSNSLGSLLVQVCKNNIIPLKMVLYGKNYHSRMAAAERRPAPKALKTRMSPFLMIPLRTVSSNRMVQDAEDELP